MRFRGKSIRRKIVVLLLVPLVSLVSIWGFATYLTSSQADRLRRVDEIARQIGDPTEHTVRAIQRERRAILVYLADPRRSEGLTQLHKLQRTTDGAISKIRRSAADGGVRSDLPRDARARLDDLIDAFDGLGKLRSKAEDNTLTRGGAFQGYNELVDPAYAFTSTLNDIDDAELEKEGRALVGVARAREYLSREDALMAAAFAAGQLTKGDQRALSDRIAERNITYRTNLVSLPAEERQRFESYWNGTDGRTLSSYEDTVIAAGTLDGTVTAKRWQSATSTALGDLERLGSEARDRYEDRARPAADKVLLQAAAAGVLGLIAVLASVIISFRVGRSLIRDLNTLRKEANESAGARLPSVLRRLAAGEEIDVEAEAPTREYPPDEIGQVGQALSTLQRAAVEAAVKQAGVRRGVSEVFVNLARRNQVLLHRQLTLLDAMERRTEDADELADLFRLDHLTTRMRRHAEGLVILSGAAPSRQWRKPVQLMDVVRAAVAEVEDYERIEVRRLPRLAVDGTAVADLTHLVAELLENATVFSPPHTGVQVLGERVVNGFTLEIHDRGLGMAPDQLLDANLRLAETPEFELSDTDRLGLFVVSRLAQRQGVRVSLQTSPYGGTTAVVLIPGSVLTETPARPDEDRTPGRTELERGGTRLRKGDRDVENAGSAARAGLQRGSSADRRALGPPPLDGPVELEAPVGELDTPSTRTRPLRKRASRPGGPSRSQPSAVPAQPTASPRQGPAGEQHQQARDETDPRPRTAGDDGSATGAPAGGRNGDGPAPLPRRRRSTPVLVSDHGRPVDSERRKDAGPEVEERSATVGGLPRRVRQANLAPQLRTDTAAEPGGPAAPAAEGTARPGKGGDNTYPDVDERDADEVRSRMAALQRGWERGRRQNEEAAAGDDTGESAQGTTPEGDGR